MYVTVAELADQVNSVSSGSLTASQTAQFTRAIQTAMAQIDGLCGRSFEASPSVRQFAPMNATLVAIGYATDITSIDLDLDGDFIYETNVPITDYDITIDTKKQRYIQLRTTALNTFTVGSNSIQVAATFGEAAVPPEISEACILQAARLWKRKDAVFGDIRGDQGYMAVPGSFDKDARQILADTGWLKPKSMVIA